MVGLLFAFSIAPETLELPHLRRTAPVAATAILPLFNRRGVT